MTLIFRARIVVMCAFALATSGCALLRSTPQPPEQWTLIAFPGAGNAGRIRIESIAGAHAAATRCVGPDSLTFALEPGCGDAETASSPRTSQLLIVSNRSRGGYRPDILRAMMTSPPIRGGFASQLASLAVADGYRGALLDLAGLGARDLNGLVNFVSELSDSSRANGLATIGIVIPVADTAAYPGRHLGPLVDYLAVRLELDPASPGPITPRDRISPLIGARAAEIGAHRIMLLIPADGYLWTGGEGRLRISFEQAVATARDWGVDFTRDETSSTLRARAPGRGEIWINDAPLIARIVRDARLLGIRRFGLYGLGGEDRAVWDSIYAPSKR